MKKNSFLLIIVVGVLASCTKPKPILPEKNSGENNQAEQKQFTGAELYQQKCIACHGSDGNLGISGAKKIPESILTLDERIQLISNGKNTMPAFKGQLSDEEIKKVAEYTVTLK